MSLFAGTRKFLLELKILQQLILDHRPAGTSGCGMSFTYNGYDFDALAGQSYCKSSSVIHRSSYMLINERIRRTHRRLCTLLVEAYRHLLFRHG